jgi:hypothetical protein
LKISPSIARTWRRTTTSTARKTAAQRGENQAPARKQDRRIRRRDRNHPRPNRLRGRKVSGANHAARQETSGANQAADRIRAPPRRKLRVRTQAARQDSRASGQSAAGQSAAGQSAAAQGAGGTKAQRGTAEASARASAKSAGTSTRSRRHEIQRVLRVSVRHERTSSQLQEARAARPNRPAPQRSGGGGSRGGGGGGGGRGGGGPRTLDVRSIAQRRFPARKQTNRPVDGGHHDPARSRHNF